jgi:hypothetical protein
VFVVLSSLWWVRCLPHSVRARLPFVAVGFVVEFGWLRFAAAESHLDSRRLATQCTSHSHHQLQPKSSRQSNRVTRRHYIAHRIITDAAHVMSRQSQQHAAEAVEEEEVEEHDAQHYDEIEKLQEMVNNTRHTHAPACTSQRAMRCRVSVTRTVSLVVVVIRITASHGLAACQTMRMQQHAYRSTHQRADEVRRTADTAPCLLAALPVRHLQVCIPSHRC